MDRAPDLSPVGPLWTQAARLLTLTTTLGPDVLLAETATIDEALGPLAANAGFRIELTALSADARLPLADLLGQPARLDLLTDASRLLPRPFHGHITQATCVGADGGFARYRLRIEPWLSLLGRNRDSYLFQDRSVVEIVDEVLGDWHGKGALIPAWRWDLADPAIYPRRGITTQYRESDLAFLRRLLADEGLFCWFEHDAAPGPQLGSHTLVIADHNAAFRDNPRPHVRFTQAGATLAEDSLDRWSESARLDSSELRSTSWDYRGLSMRPQASASAIGIDARASAIARDDPGAYAWPTAEDGERLLRRERESIDARMRDARAEGSLRSAAPGTLFTLAEHARVSHDAESRHLITAVMHRARNNLAALLAPTPGDADSIEEADFYRNQLSCVPAATPWRPALKDDDGRRLHPRPSASGPATAIVIGDCPDRGEPAPTHCDRDHRIRVQFHWQRGSRAASRHAHPGGSDNAPAAAPHGAWLRVLAPAAGPDWGGHFVPRPGQEVLIAFQHGDIDRPVVIGSVYNGRGNTDGPGNQVAGAPQHATANAPAWFKGLDDPAHRHGALTGIRTRELGATRHGKGGHNQLAFDSSPGEARIDLSTTSHRTHLQLGHLRQQDGNARRASRGHGAELATRAALATRAGSGLLISADPRPDARGDHLDSREPIERSAHARDLVQSLAASAFRHHAALGAGDTLPECLAATQSLDRALTALRATASTGARPPSEERTRPASGGTGTVSAWTSPRIQYSAPAGIAQLTPADLILSAGQHFVTATRHAQFVSGATHHLATTQGLSLFTTGRGENGPHPDTAPGIRLHAAHGNASLQSQHGKFNAAADATVTLASTGSSLTAGARQHVLATAQGAYLRIEGDDIQLHAPGRIAFQASAKNLTGPRATVLPLHEFPVLPTQGICSAVFDTGSLVHNDPCLAGARFEIWSREDVPSLLARGTLDELNRSFVVGTDTPQAVELLAGEGEWTDFVDYGDWENGEPE